MLNFLAFLLSVVILVCVSIYMHRLGYLAGKVEVSHIERGELPKYKVVLHPGEIISTKDQTEEITKAFHDKFNELKG